MSDSLRKPWFDSSYAPESLLSVYHKERVALAGMYITAVFYGIVIILFFRCMDALFNAANCPRRSIKWPLVAHAVAMFSILAVSAVIYINARLVSYIDNQRFTGDNGLEFPGPLLSRDYIYSQANSVVLNITIFLNACLADGLLICRCYVVYSMNYWVIAFPCLMYLASLALSIAFVFRSSRPAVGGLLFPIPYTNYEIPYFSISFALNILLTLMIVIRLFLLHRRIRNAINAPVRVHGLYRVIVTSLIESCALYSVTLVLTIGLWAARSPIWAVFSSVIPLIQVIAPFLITIQIANQSASTNVTVASGSISSIRFGSRGGSTGDKGTTSDGCPAGPTGTFGETGPTKPAAAVDTTTNLHPDDGLLGPRPPIHIAGNLPPLSPLG